MVPSNLPLTWVMKVLRIVSKPRNSNLRKIILYIDSLPETWCKISTFRYWVFQPITKWVCNFNLSAILWLVEIVGEGQNFCSGRLSHNYTLFFFDRLRNLLHKFTWIVMSVHNKLGKFWQIYGQMQNIISS